MPWISPPSLYKARHVPTKQSVCAICIDRTRGKTLRVQLTHRVSVWLCEAHASREFQTRGSGRDFVTTLHRIWKANECLTVARDRALSAHLERLRGAKTQRPRPGSYAWPDLRRNVEAEYAHGTTPRQAHAAIHARYADCPAKPPSRRTVQRWHAQRRWLVRPP